MSIRDRYANIAPWIAVAVFCVIAATLYWSHTYSKGRQAEREYYQTELGVYDAQQQAYEDCLRSNSIDRARECYEVSRNPNREEQRAEQDLSAQREMADWAEGMLIVSAIVGFSTVLAASAAAWFAFGAIRETRRIGEAQTRAYMTTSGAEAVYRDGQLHVTVHAQNTGQSPALAVRTHTSIAIEPGPFDPMWLKDELDIDFRSDVGAGQSVHLRTEGPVPPNPHLLYSMVVEKLEIWVYATIAYSDVFGRPHTTRCCYQMESHPNANGYVGRIMPVGNSMD